MIIYTEKSTETINFRSQESTAMLLELESNMKITKFLCTNFNQLENKMPFVIGNKCKLSDIS
jgi:hypothetical protein